MVSFEVPSLSLERKPQYLIFDMLISGNTNICSICLFVCFLYEQILQPSTTSLVLCGAENVNTCCWVYSWCNFNMCQWIL